MCGEHQLDVEVADLLEKVLFTNLLGSEFFKEMRQWVWTGCLLVKLSLTAVTHHMVLLSDVGKVEKI